VNIPPAPENIATFWTEFIIHQASKCFIPKVLHVPSSSMVACVPAPTLQSRRRLYSLGADFTVSAPTRAHSTMQQHGKRVQHKFAEQLVMSKRLHTPSPGRVVGHRVSEQTPEAYVVNNGCTINNYYQSSLPTEHSGDFVQLPRQEFQDLKDRISDIERALASQVGDAVQVIPPYEQWLYGEEDARVEVVAKEEDFVGIIEATHAGECIQFGPAPVQSTMTAPERRWVAYLPHPTSYSLHMGDEPSTDHSTMVNITDCNKPQTGDIIVVFFNGKWHTGVVTKAVLDVCGAELYSVKYRCGLVTSNDTLVGFKWRFAASSPKYIPPEPKSRVKRGRYTHIMATTGRERTGVIAFKAESATADKKRTIDKLNHKVVRIDPDPEDEARVLHVEVDTDSYDVSGVETLDQSCVTVIGAVCAD
jgi:hypothetical protein